MKRFKFRHALYRRRVDAHYMKLNMPRHIHTDAGENGLLVSGELSYPIENQMKSKLEETSDPVHPKHNMDTDSLLNKNLIININLNW